uniref:U3 snoRNP-associated protein-like EMB2271 n=1 Tax=Rhizophora mucronata TaxID=61149 RepID=A0A2P2JI69_RHIMU
MVKICLRPTDASTVEWKRHFEHMQSVPIFLGEVPDQLQRQENSQILQSPRNSQSRPMEDHTMVECL